MNISYKWLKEYVDFDMSAHEVAEALTSIGLEVGSVEEIQAIKGGLEGLCTGEVLTCEQHPNSDHMHICTVDVGADDALQIVCGAPNVAAGQKVIVATIGTKLYAGDECFTIKRSKLRGVESLGMICAEDEIGVGQSHDGIIVLPADTPVGMKAADYYGLESDWLIEVDITPNRADACSHYGVARDLYAWLVQQGKTTALHRMEVDDFKVDNHDLDIDVLVENTEACPRYCAVTVKNCKVAESPEWLKQKLTSIGLRPINNIVDITNYVMMAYGQPLHCFDADMIDGRKVVVRTLPEGTKFQTLDGEEHTLSDRDLMICNENEPMCLAGVFGGKGSGTYDSTCHVLLESAYFHPSWVRKSARRHGISTDASFRFERGVDPAGQLYALKVAAKLVKELAGGEIAMDIKDVDAGNTPRSFEVNLPYQYVHELIGKEIPAETIKRIVTSLEMEVLEESESHVLLRVPAYRVDVQRPCDVVEEILRIYGYNNVEIPTAVKSSLTVKGDVDRSNKLENLIGEQLAGQGFREILNNSLTRESYYAGSASYPATSLVRLINPLSSDLGVLRQSLVFGGLESIAHNVNRKMTDLRFFETGNCYALKPDAAPDDKLPYVETERLALWITGRRVAGSWAHADEESNVYEIAAAVRNIMARLGLNAGQLKQAAGQNDLFAKSRVVTDRNGKLLAEWGVLSREVTRLFDLRQEVYYAEINLQPLFRLSEKSPLEFRDWSKFPAVSRDLALLVDKNVEFAAIEQAAMQAERKLLKKVELFDVYEGKNLEPGKKSYAVNFTLQDAGKTMNDKQTDAVMKRIIAALEKAVGAKLR